MLKKVLKTNIKRSLENQQKSNDLILFAYHLFAKPFKINVIHGQPFTPLPQAYKSVVCTRLFTYFQTVHVL